MRLKLVALVALLVLPNPMAKSNRVGLANIPDHCLLMMPVTVPQDPPEGNPGHKEPAPDYACKHDSKDPAHNCPCHRRCLPPTDDEGNVQPGPSQQVSKDPKCRTYCFENHCHCPVENCE